jgi:hypothetical protein
MLVDSQLGPREGLENLNLGLVSYYADLKIDVNTPGMFMIKEVDEEYEPPELLNLGDDSGTSGENLP